MAAIVSPPMELVGFGPEDAEIAANLLPKTQPHGLSLGDRACLALAMTRSIPAMTTDQAWPEVPVDVTIRCIRHLPLNPAVGG
jgi:PIN domain nuclease of toxin-antitoxin system